VKQVDKVRHSANFDGCHFILPGDAAQERPESFLGSRARLLTK
jgi:hypothetical protein